ncbi:trigger factor [Membranihabitans maritimus]|uniref:trigger factor n=1 Tax=Membranihabitans maritimus TaxID=2904244 RepID=UPI001F0015D5|nr:trigger factor [Membranihabitans maritimus]
MKIDFNKKDDLNAQISISIENEDYSGKLENELRNYQKKSNLKGFRKGKTPKSMIRKMYGKSLLADIVNQKIQEELGGYLKDNEIEFLGQPIPSEDQTLINFDPNSKQSYDFTFDLGLTPDFEINGIETPFKYYDAIITDEDIETEWERYRKQKGERVDVEENFEDNDYITFNAVELENGEVKPKGLETTISILVSVVDDQEVKDKILSAKKGDKIQFNVNTLEKERSEEYVRKYILKLGEEEMDRDYNPEFEGEIVEVKRVVPAEVNEEFITSVFGEEIKTEEEAKDSIKKEIKSYYDSQADAILFRDIQNKIMEESEIHLPDAFLKRWIEFNNDKLGPEEVAKEYENYFADNLRWTLIRNKLVKKHEIEVQPEDIHNEMRTRVMRYAGGYNLGEDFINQTVQRLMQDQKQVEDAYEEILSSMVFDTLKDDVELDKEEIEQDKLMEIIQDLKSKNQGPGTDEEE